VVVSSRQRGGQDTLPRGQLFKLAPFAPNVPEMTCAAELKAQGNAAWAAGDAAAAVAFYTEVRRCEARVFVACGASSELPQHD
jgi:hypothetical protein